MIVSASYKTDIPAFYGEWFLNRLRAGFCLQRNPYGGQIYRVSLAPEDAAGFVFWTKNAGPFLPALREVKERGQPFVVQYTINGYPRVLERSVLEEKRAVEHMKQIAAEYGPRVAVWRYDPILFSSLTPPEFHRSGFERLARALEGTTDEVVVSFAQVYKKTLTNMNWAAREYGFTWDDPPAETKRTLLGDLVQVARAHGLRLTICTQPELMVEGAGEARCIDSERLADVAGHPMQAKEKGNRPGCRCAASRDIGDYDTCPHGCVYCYAVRRRELAQSRYREHDPTSELLFGQPPKTMRRSLPAAVPRQQELF